MVNVEEEINLVDSKFNEVKIGDEVKFDRDIRFDEAEIDEGETGVIIEWQGEGDGKKCAIKLHTEHSELKDLDNCFPLKTYNRQSIEDKEAKAMILDFLTKI